MSFRREEKTATNVIKGHVFQAEQEKGGGRGQRHCEETEGPHVLLKLFLKHCF